MLALFFDKSRFPTKDRGVVTKSLMLMVVRVGFRHNPRCSTQCPALESPDDEVGSERDRHLLHAVAPIAAESLLVLRSLGIESISYLHRRH
jgi:hypothetical protein